MVPALTAIWIPTKKAGPQKYFRQQIAVNTGIPFLQPHCYMKGCVKTKLKTSGIINHVEVSTVVILLLLRWTVNRIATYWLMSSFYFLSLSLIFRHTYLKSRCLLGSTNQADPSCFYLSTSEFHEYWWNDVDSNFLVPAGFCRTSEASNIDCFKNQVWIFRG